MACCWVCLCLSVWMYVSLSLSPSVPHSPLLNFSFSLSPSHLSLVRTFSFSLSPHPFPTHLMAGLDGRLGCLRDKPLQVKWWLRCWGLGHHESQPHRCAAPTALYSRLRYSAGCPPSRVTLIGDARTVLGSPAATVCARPRTAAAGPRRGRRAGRTCSACGTRRAAARTPFAARAPLAAGSTAVEAHFPRRALRGGLHSHGRRA